MPKSKKLIVFAAVIAILLLAVGSLFVFSNSSAQLRKKAIETVKYALPGCEYVETVEAEDGDVYVFINPEGVEFFVWYSNETEMGTFRWVLLSTYSFAVINHYAENIENTSYPGVQAKLTKAHTINIYVDGEQYFENAVRLCVDLQNTFKLNIKEDCENQFRTTPTGFYFCIKNDSEEYIKFRHAISMATTPENWNNYDALYDWLITEYNNQSK